MKKGMTVALAAGIALMLGSTVLAATANNVAELEKEVQDKLQSVQVESLTDEQKAMIASAYGGRHGQIASMTDEQKAQWEAARADREAKLQAFKATLSAEQAAALEDLMPQAQGQTRAKPTEAERQTMQARYDAFLASLSDAQKAEFEAMFQHKGLTSLDNMTAEQKAQMEAKIAERQAQEAAFEAMLNAEQKEVYNAMKPQQPQDGTRLEKPTDTERQAMQAQRAAFEAMLTAEQKAAYEALHQGFGKRLENMTQAQLDQRASDLQKALDMLNSIAA